MNETNRKYKTKQNKRDKHCVASTNRAVQAHLKQQIQNKQTNKNHEQKRHHQFFLTNLDRIQNLYV